MLDRLEGLPVVQCFVQNRFSVSTAWYVRGMYRLTERLYCTLRVVTDTETGIQDTELDIYRGMAGKKVVFVKSIDVTRIDLIVPLYDSVMIL
jgi:hypothetical protein